MRELSPGDPAVVGPYRTLAELGSGGMGRVLLASGPDGRLVALKLVHRQFAEEPGFRARFRAEVAASSAVSGAYTAAVVDADPDAATPWLASVFVPGPSLQDVLDVAGALPEEPVRRLAAGLAAALIRIHRAGLVHRDLKPSNVLLAGDGPRVIDFGIARAVGGDRQAGLTRTGWLIGSPAFMSPEQARSEAATPASDVFSLGSVLAAAYTGGSPFADQGTLQTLNNVVRAEPDLSALPAAICDLVRPCLAADPADRPTPAELLEAVGSIAPSTNPWPPAVERLITENATELDRFLAQAPDDRTKPLSHSVAGSGRTEPVTRDEAGDEKPPTKLVPKSRRRAVLSALVLVLVLVGAATWVWWPTPPAPAAAPPQPRSPLTRIGALSGPSHPRFARFSHNGATVAVVNSDNSVQLWDVAARKPIGQILGPFGETGPSDLAFRSDDRTLVTAKVDGEDAVVQSWEAASGRQVGEPLVVDKIDNRIFAPTLSPDGALVAVSDEDDDLQHGVFLWNVADRRLAGRLEASVNVSGVIFSPDGRTVVVHDWTEAGTAPLTLWDTASLRRFGNQITLPKGEPLSNVSFGRDSRSFVTASGGGKDDPTLRVRQWDVSTQNQLRATFPFASAADRTPEGSYPMALGGQDGKHVFTLAGDVLVVRDLDGKQDGAELAGIRWLTLSPDGHTIATTSAETSDTSLKLWRMP